MNCHDAFGFFKKRGMCVLISYVLMSLPACADDARTKKLPFAQAVAVQKRGSLVDVELLIPEERVYAFSLQFMFKEGDEKDYARVRQLIGAFERNSNRNSLKAGEPLALNLRVEDTESNNIKVIFDQPLKVDEIQVSSWGGSSFTKELTALKLPRGRYHIVVSADQDTPAFAGADVKFLTTIAYRGK
jgi:hypothetical protein